MTSSSPSIPVYITCFNQESVKGMAEYFLRAENCYPVVVDNASSLFSIVEWLDSNPCEVVRLSENLGPRAAWRSGIVGALDPEKTPYYAVTDGDLDFSNCPLDVVSRSVEALEAHPYYIKVGVSLVVGDLPDTPIARDARIKEAKNWKTEVAPGLFDSVFGTAFAVYSKSRNPHGYTPALRLAPPYSARHLPWYCSDLEYLERVKDQPYLPHIYYTTKIVNERY